MPTIVLSYIYGLRVFICTCLEMWLSEREEEISLSRFLFVSYVFRASSASQDATIRLRGGPFHVRPELCARESVSRDYKDAHGRCHARSHAINVTRIFARKYIPRETSFTRQHTVRQRPSRRSPLRVFLLSIPLIFSFPLPLLTLSM